MLFGNLHLYFTTVLEAEDRKNPFLKMEGIAMPERTYKAFRINLSPKLILNDAVYLRQRGGGRERVAGKGAQERASISHPSPGTPDTCWRPGLGQL